MGIVYSTRALKAMSDLLDAYGNTTIGGLGDVNITNIQDNQILKYDSATEKFVNEADAGGSGSPGGADTQVQFNDLGAFGGDAGFTYNKATNTATLGVLIVPTLIGVTSSGGDLNLESTSHGTKGDVNILDNLNIPTTTADIGIIKSNGDRFIHGFGGTTNFFAGVNAGNFTMSGATQNTAIGGNAGADLTSGDNNVFLGYQAGNSTTSGLRNIFIGVSAGTAITTASNSVAVGDSAMRAQTSGSTVAIGYNALRYNVTGTGNTAIGYVAGTGVSGNSHSANTFIGSAAGNGITTGSNNTCVGNASGQFITTGTSNTLIGKGAGLSLIAGNENMALGSAAGSFNETGNNNLYLGTLAGRGVSGNSHSNNTFVGFSAGMAITTGGTNVCLGGLAGNSLTTGAGNIIIGYDADAPTATTSNHLNIGSTLYGDLTDNNIGVGAFTWGTSAAKVLIIGTGTPPDDSPADGVQIYSADRGGVGGKAALHIRTEDGSINVSGDFSSFGVASPLAVLHLKAGTATAGTGPFKFEAGTNLTSPEAGVFEYDGTNLFFTADTDSGRQVVNLGNYAGLTVDQNAVATTVRVVDVWTKLSVYDTDLPEMVSNAANATDDITIGKTGDYMVNWTVTAEPAGNNKTFDYGVFELDADIPITSSTDADPVVVTTTGAHGLSTGNKVKISGVTTQVEINDQIFEITVLSGTTFSLQNDESVDINGTGHAGAGTGGNANLAVETTASAGRKYGTTDRGTSSSMSICACTKDKTLELYLKNQTDAVNITAESSNLFISQIG